VGLNLSDLEAEQAGKVQERTHAKGMGVSAYPPFPLKTCSFPDQESKRIASQYVEDSQK
jgi:hypothetical protein